VVYLFDRERGRLLRRLSGLKDRVFRLAFSPDGEYLAALFRHGLGVRVWDTQDWGEVFADRDYGSDSYGCAFDAANRLATTCWDGLLRLYGPEKGRGFRLLSKAQAPGGGKPFRIAFSPDGERLAVGYADTAAISVLSGTDLSPLFSPDTMGIDNGGLSNVAWSADGRFLYAGGRYKDSRGDYPILRWAESGRGERKALAAVRNTVIDLKSWAMLGSSSPPPSRGSAASTAMAQCASTASPRPGTSVSTISAAPSPPPGTGARCVSCSG